MGMPITIEVVDQNVRLENLEKAFAYFRAVDERFSTYKDTSEISAINQGKVKAKNFSSEMKTVLALAEETKRQTGGFFDISNNGWLDPSGIVKGWAIANAAEILKKDGLKNFYLEAGGDIQVSGRNKQSQTWQIGIRNPFNIGEIVKVIKLGSGAVATSGTYERGHHIYNPKTKTNVSEIVSLSVIGPNIYEADRFATAAFAMGKAGILFIEKLTGFEGYMIDNAGLATLTTGFERYTV